MYTNPSSINDMFRLRIKKLELKALTETDNYINVSRQLEVETRRFKESLKHSNIPLNDALVESNTYGNSKIFYMVMCYLSGTTFAAKINIEMIIRIVNTVRLDGGDSLALFSFIMVAMFYMIFPDESRRKINDIKQKADLFLKSIDVRKYHID